MSGRHAQRFSLAVLTALLLAGQAAPTPAQDMQPASLEACASIASDSQRLACYDRLAGRKPRADEARETPAAEADSANQPGAEPRSDRLAGLASHLHSYLHQGGKPGNDSLLDSRWELARDSKLGTFNVRGYKPVYIEPLFVTSNVNETPATPNPDNVVSESLQLKSVEAKFQISFKAKLVQGLIAGYGDLWAAYTQSSHWQVYNSAISRPFRETNYEPELMAAFGTNIPVFGWHVRMLGLGFNHQSNGRAKPLSRSWNRIMGRVALERPGWTIMLRPWLRVSEDAAKDDNPDITDYLGHGDVNIIHAWRDQEFRLMLRHNFATDRGAGRFTWSFPIGHGLHGYMEVFNGFGESLIDYNHQATYFGLGVSLVNWY